MSDDIHVHLHLDGLDGLLAIALSDRHLLREILDKLTSMETKMSQMDDDITALQASVASENTVIASAVTLMNGISAQITAAVNAALAAGATPAQLQAVTDLKTAVDTNQAALAAAVTANTPPPGPVTS
jgi:hypothetical protein